MQCSTAVDAARGCSLVCTRWMALARADLQRRPTRALILTLPDACALRRLCTTYTSHTDHESIDSGLAAAAQWLDPRRDDDEWAGLEPHIAFRTLGAFVERVEARLASVVEGGLAGEVGHNWRVAWQNNFQANGLTGHDVESFVDGADGVFAGAVLTFLQICFERSGALSMDAGDVIVHGWRGWESYGDTCVRDQLFEILEDRLGYAYVAGHPDPNAALYVGDPGFLYRYQLYASSGRAPNIDSLDSHGVTRLFEAAWHGHLAALTCLISAGANIDKPSGPEGCSPLMIAAHRGHTAVVDALLEAGADATLVDDDGDSALDLADDPDVRRALRRALRARCGAGAA